MEIWNLFGYDQEASVMCLNFVRVCFVHHRHAQALAALQAYSHWLAQFYTEVHNQNQSQFINLITSAIDASSPLITAKVCDSSLSRFVFRVLGLFHVFIIA